jgi:predicted short-subunit dehydrogenase-like oxidoreductase (DUF2520 family)
MRPGGGGTVTRVAIIGPGRAGTAVALAAAEAGYHMDAVAGRGETALERFVALAPTARIMPAAQATRSADLVVLAVPDHAVGPVARELAVAEAVAPGSRWIHLAGSLGLGVLQPIRLAGAQIAACHPAQTLPDPEAGRVALDGCAWAVTATDASRSWARRLVRDLGGEPFDVADADRAAYHTAMSLGANAVSAFVTLARELLLGVGVTEPEAFLTPLSVAAAEGAARDGARALTGPVRRGDAETVATHLRELAVVMPEAVAAYREAARLALGQARRAGLDAAAAGNVARALDSAPNRNDDGE